MSDLANETRLYAAGIIKAAAASAQAAGLLPEGELPPFVVETPDDTSHGDLAVNAAMVSARTFRMSPKKIAEILCNAIVDEWGLFDRIETAGPGFINLFLSRRWFAGVIENVLRDKDLYGRSDYGRGEKIMVEFVSANPTGPMHIGNARGAAIGDCLASALQWAGYQVTREFYINDAGNQIAKFGQSLSARYRQIFLGSAAVDFPEDGYHGEDITIRARQFADVFGDALLNEDEEKRAAALIDFVLPKNIEAMKDILKAYRVEYDVWFPESSLHSSGAIDDAVAKLSELGLTFEKDGAVWYKASEFGAQKDEVLIRSNGTPTYFAADIAYHYNKFKVRSFSRVINVWGADHHGHVARLKGAMDAIGLDGSALDIVLMQLVRLMKDGEPFRVSKRTGKSITLIDLISEVPVDAARFFFNMREPGSPLDFDLDLAASQTAQNPVYYVQYANARICSIVKNLAEEGIVPRGCSTEELCLLDSDEESDLIRAISLLPSEIVTAAKNYDPARLTHYVIDVATLFHKFYNAHRVKCDSEPLMQARLNLCLAVQTVIRNVCAILKVDTPDTM